MYSSNLSLFLEAFFVGISISISYWLFFNELPHRFKRQKLYSMYINSEKTFAIDLFGVMSGVIWSLSMGLVFSVFAPNAILYSILFVIGTIGFFDRGSYYGSLIFFHKKKAFVVEFIGLIVGILIILFFVSMFLEKNMFVLVSPVLLGGLIGGITLLSTRPILYKLHPIILSLIISSLIFFNFILITSIGIQLL